MYEKAVSFLENKIFVSTGHRGWLTLRTAASGISTNPIKLYCIKKGNHLTENVIILQDFWRKRKTEKGDRSFSFNFLHYLVHDTEYNGVNKADSSHSHQTQQEEVGIAVQLEVGGFGIKDGAHQLAFSCAETWVKKRNFWSFLSLTLFHSVIWTEAKCSDQMDFYRSNSKLVVLNWQTILFQPTLSSSHLAVI